MPTQNPTAKQQQVLDFVKGFLDENGFAPTFGQIGKHVTLTRAGVKSHLDALEARGFITRNTNESRTIKISSGDRASQNRKKPLEPRKLERMVLDISARLDSLEAKEKP